MVTRHENHGTAFGVAHGAPVEAERQGERQRNPMSELTVSRLVASKAPRIGLPVGVGIGAVGSARRVPLARFDLGKVKGPDWSSTNLSAQPLADTRAIRIGVAPIQQYRGIVICRRGGPLPDADCAPPRIGLALLRGARSALVADNGASSGRLMHRNGRVRLFFPFECRRRGRC